MKKCVPLAILKAEGGTFWFNTTLTQMHGPTVGFRNKADAEAEASRLTQLESYGFPTTFFTCKAESRCEQRLVTTVVPYTTPLL